MKDCTRIYIDGVWVEPLDGKIIDVINPATERSAGQITGIPARPPAWAAAIGRVNDYVMNDLGGGPRPWKLAWVINFQKLGTLAVLGGCIAWYHNTSAAAWIYLAMHGTSCLVWLIKDLTFPDPNFHKRITIGAGVASFLSVLGW